MKNCILIISLIITSKVAFARRARVITCFEKSPQTIRVPFNNVMVIEFPEKPMESLPGRSNFDFKFIKNDLAIKGLRLGGSANLFVYLPRRRCSFKLYTTNKKSDDIVKIRYPKESTIEATYE